MEFKGKKYPHPLKFRIKALQSEPDEQTLDFLQNNSQFLIPRIIF